MDYQKYKQFEFRRKFWKLFGAEISIFEPSSGALIGFIKMKAWKLREDIRIFTDKSMQQEIMRIRARQVIDFGATYDVTGPSDMDMLFSFRRKGLKSNFVRDHWDLLNPNGDVVGTVEETSSGLAIARRYLGIIPFVGFIFDLVFAFIPQTYSVMQNGPDGRPLVGGTITHRKNPVLVKLSADMTNPQIDIDPRIVFAATALITIVEASKNS